MEVFLIALLAVVVTRTHSAAVCDTCECIFRDSMGIINCSSRGVNRTFFNQAHWPENVQSQQGDLQVSVLVERNAIGRVDQFPVLPKVVRLSLAHNVILDIATHAFLQLDSLTHLDLSFNLLTGDSLRADVLRGSYHEEEYEPMALISLNLAYNNIHSLESRAFEHLPHLQELSLSGNPLMEIDDSTLTALGRPAGLVALDLSATGLSALPDRLVHKSSLKNHLEVLILSANNFTEVPEEISALGSSLWELNLNDNPITELVEDSLLGLRRLRVLSISGMPHLKRIGPAAFDELDSLTTVYAAHNPHLSDIDVDAFRRQRLTRTLREVHLEQCALDGLPQGLLHWEDLDILDIQSNPWLCDCQQQWLSEQLVPHIAERDPEHTIELHCQAPLWLAGVSLVTLSHEPDRGRKALCAPEPRDPPLMKRIRQRSLAAKLLLGAAVCICCVATITTCFFCYRRLKHFKPQVLGTVVYIPVREETLRV